MPGIDVHTHLAPALRPANLAALSGVAARDDGMLTADGQRVGPPALYAASALEEYLDRAGLEQAVVSVPPPFYRQHLDETAAARWTGAINDGIGRRVAGRSRLLPLAYLPLEHPELARAEYERVRDDDRFAGVVASAGGASVVPSDPALAPLWKALDFDGRMLLLHPGAAADPRLDAFYLANLLGNPSETAVAVAHLVLGNIVATHPGLRIVLVHCGGTVPALAGRWQRGVDTARPGIGLLTEPPRQAIRRFYVDCLAHDPAVVDLAVATFGADRIVLGSDWPFPMGTSDPLSLVAHRGPGLVHAAAVGNARQALGLTRRGERHA